MPKPILASTVFTSTVLALLAVPAAADDTVMYRVDYSLAADGPTHKDTLFVSDNSCGEMSSKSSARESTIRVCARQLDSKRVRLEIDRHLRDKADEKRALSVVIATSGTIVTFLDAKMTISVQ